MTSILHRRARLARAHGGSGGFTYGGRMSRSGRLSRVPDHQRARAADHRSRREPWWRWEHAWAWPRRAMATIPDGIRPADGRPRFGSTVSVGGDPGRG